MNRNGLNKFIDPIRLSANEAARQFGVRATHIKRGLIREQIEAGVDGRFSVREIFLALNDLSKLEQESKRARFQSKIDQAEFFKMRLAEKQEKLIPIEQALDVIHDFTTIFFQGVRHSSMTQQEKCQLLGQYEGNRQQEIFSPMANKKHPFNAKLGRSFSVKELCDPSIQRTLMRRTVVKIFNSAHHPAHEKPIHYDSLAGRSVRSYKHNGRTIWC